MNNIIVMNPNETLPKYIIEGEGEFDFTTELNNYMGEDTTIETCLISQQPLSKSHITLPCNHKFNYMSLFKEVCNQKQKNMLEVRQLKTHQIKCPYCRTVFDNLLPYIPSECPEKKNGVNYPLRYAMNMPIKCEWDYNMKKNTNKAAPIEPCEKSVQYITENNCYCKQHYLKATAPKKAKPAKEKIILVEWTAEMEDINIKHSMFDFKKILRLHNLKISGNKRELVERLFSNNLLNELATI